MRAAIKRLIWGTALHRFLRRIRSARQPRDLNHRYDAETIEVMRRVLRPDSNAVDVGAHEGTVLIEMTDLAPRGQHHAFEALPHLAAKLRTLFPRAQIHQVAVADQPGQAEFQFVENAPAYSGLRQRIYDHSDPVITSIPVTVTTLDRTLPADLPIAFLKIDIEGGEYHALRGAIETLRRCHPVIVFEAGPNSTGQYGVTPDQIYDFLVTELGYELTTMQRWLARQAPYTRDEYRQNWEQGPDYYFLAAPGSAAIPSNTT